MPKVSPIQNSFNAGELSPLLAGRTDIDRYKAGLKTCINYIPALQGPLMRRPGTKYVHEVRHSNREQVLLPFKYSRDESYIIEFGTDDVAGVNNEYFRFYKDNALVTLPDKTITGVTQGSPATVTAVSHGFATADRVVISDVSGMTALNNREFIVTSLTVNTFSIADAQTSASIDSSAYIAYSGGGVAAKPYEIYGAVTSGATLSFNEFKIAQSADVLFVAGPEHYPFKLSRFADTSWTFGAVVHTDGPYLPVNDTTTTLTPSDVTGTISIVASGVTGINYNQGFSASDIGRLVRIQHTITWGHATITAVGSSVSVTAAMNGSFATNTASAEWRLGAWRTGTEYPNSVCFHEGRLWWGGGVNKQLIACSASDDFETYSPTDATSHIDPSSAFTVIANGGEANAVQWLASDEKGLVVGTKGGPWVLRANSASGVLEADSGMNYKKASSYGSAEFQPVQVDKAFLHVQNSGKKIREFLYYYDVDGFKSADLSVLSEHIVAEGVSRLAHQKEPQPLLWGMRDDGVLIGLTYERETDTLKAGWHRHNLGGYSDASQTANAQLKSMAVIPNSDGTQEQLWLVTKRYVNGRTRRFVEYMVPFFEDTTELEDAFFVDSGLTYDSTVATLAVTGLFHLAGQVVSVLADGVVLSDRTVSTTAFHVSLDSAATKVHIGLPYTSRGQMMRLEAGAADGTAMGKTQRMNRVGLMLHNTGGLKIGMDFSNMREINFRDASDAMDSPVPLFTGIKSMEIEADYSFENEFCWEQTAPLPGTIVAIMPQLTTQDR